MSKRGKATYKVAHGRAGMIGVRFNMLIVLSEAEQRGRKALWWSCVCDCGMTCEVMGSNLRSGDTKSCGCLHHRTKPNLRHGMSKSPTHITWCAMRRRCSSPNAKNYHRYGGRGIKVCDRWSVFENFLADMGERPPGSTIEREDNDGNYETGNCRWATPKEQAGNRSTCLPVDVRSIAKERGISDSHAYVLYHKGEL